MLLIDFRFLSGMVDAGTCSRGVNDTNRANLVRCGSSRAMPIVASAMGTSPLADLLESTTPSPFISVKHDSRWTSNPDHPTRNVLVYKDNIGLLVNNLQEWDRCYRVSNVTNVLGAGT